MGGFANNLVRWWNKTVRSLRLDWCSQEQENKFETIQPQIADALAQTVEIWLPDVSLAIPVKRHTLACLGRKRSPGIKDDVSKTAHIVYQTTFFLKIGPNPVPGSNPPKPKRLVFGMDLILPASKKLIAKAGKVLYFSFFFVKYGTFFGKNHSRHSQWRCYKLVLVSGSVPED